MKTHILSVLLLTAAFPLAAAAQNATTSPGGATSAQQATPSVTPAPADGSNSKMGSGASTDSGSAMNNNTMPSTQTASASGETFVTLPETGAWRVSDLQGKTVYASDGANIGEINDVLVSQDGSINAVIIGVGGFLGIGEKDVAVNMSALELGPGDTQAQADAASKALPNTTGATGATGATGTTGMDATGTAGMGTSGATGTGAAGTAATTPDQSATNMAANNNGAKIGKDGLPDRIILNVTRDQLEKAPAFKGVRGEQNK
ncbi:PRC-barrel domain-containing protein [Pleomorphomonas oryzae]|uniref:PRC-barrel domain-containing protein n=1 Tax=Pleomorphomonas oryzae TaxID=261934 RepID=UPI000400908C|nr:PRC-barrel domain-containing protein [Pleomorphomonas oryzae]